MGSLRNLYVPRELTQYLRRKYCREELHLPPRFNYFWDLSAAALDSRSRDSDDCENMYSVDEAFPLLEDVPTVPSPSILQPPPPPSPMPPGEWKAHDVSIGLHLRPHSPPSANTTAGAARFTWRAVPARGGGLHPASERCGRNECRRCSARARTLSDDPRRSRAALHTTEWHHLLCDHRHER